MGDEQVTGQAMTTMASSYVLRGPEGSVWIAEVPPTMNPGGIMPHLAPGDDVQVLGTNADGSLAIKLPRRSGIEFDLELTAYEVPATVAAELARLWPPTPGAGPEHG